MSYTMYTPLNVWLDPASVTDVVAYIQNYLSENTIYSEEEIETLIHDYLEAHPELIGGVQSVNGKTGTVVLSASDINTANNVTIESVLSSLSSQISSIAASVATNTTNITNLTGRVTTAETDLSNLKSSLNDQFYGSTQDFVISSQGRSWYFPFFIAKGAQYTFTNNTNNTCTLNCIKPDGTNILIAQPINPGNAYTFIADDDYNQFGGYFNGTGSVKMSTEFGLHDLSSAINTANDNNTNIKMNGLVNGLIWANRIYYYADNAWGDSLGRIGTQETFLLRQNTLIVADEGYKISVMRFSSGTPSSDNKIGTTGWVQSAKAQSGDYILINMRNDPDSGRISPDAGKSHIYFLINIGSVDDYTRKYYGEKFPTKPNWFNVSNYMSISYDSSHTLNDSDYYNGNIYCAIDPGYIRVYDLASKTLLHEISADVAHGNVLQISNEFADNSDPVPLIYTGWEGNVNVIRINSSWTATVEKRFKFDAQYGYMASAVLDFNRGVAYVFGYSLDDHTSAGGDNSIIFTVANINDTTIDETGAYLPTVLSRKNISWFGSMQGAKYTNNRIYFATANTSSPYNPKIFAITTDGSIVSEISDFNNAINGELESLFFVTDESKIVMYCSTYFNFFKFDFET